jgi:hypothetical protein
LTSNFLLALFFFFPLTYTYGIFMACILPTEGLRHVALKIHLPE